MALLIIAVAGVLNALLFLGLRHLVVLGCGMSDPRLALGLRLRWPPASLARRVAFTVSGPVGCYFAAGLLMAVSLVVTGRTVVDDTSMRVTVAVDGPAATAGFKGGDRVVAINALPVGDWPALKAAVSAHRGEPIDVTVERDGAELVLHPTPLPSTGRINIGPYAHREPVSLLGGALAVFVQPGLVVAEIARAWVHRFGGHGGDIESVGGRGVARMADEAAARGLATGVGFVGSLNAYLLFLPCLLALVLFPRAG